MAPQVSQLFRSKLKHEIFRKAIQISFYSTIQLFCFDFIKFSQITVEHDFLAAKQQDVFFNPFRWDQYVRFSHRACFSFIIFV